jgi:P-type Cu+ transporter
MECFPLKNSWNMRPTPKEPIPVEKIAGDKVVGETVNGTGALIMRAEKVGAETLLSRIVAMVAEARRSRMPIQKLAETLSGYFVPIVVPLLGYGAGCDLDC